MQDKTLDFFHNAFSVSSTAERNSPVFLNTEAKTKSCILKASLSQPSPPMLPNERRLPGTVIKSTGLANNPGYPKSVLGVLLDGPINLKYLYFIF